MTIRGTRGMIGQVMEYFWDEVWMRFIQRGVGSFRPCCLFLKDVIVEEARTLAGYKVGINGMYEYIWGYAKGREEKWTTEFESRNEKVQ